MSLFDQTKGGRTHIFTHVLSQILLNVLCIYMVPWVCEHFPPPLLIALSVVSMEVFAPYKMAEMRLSAWLRGGPVSENTILYGFTETIMNRVDYDIFVNSNRTPFLNSLTAQLPFTNNTNRVFSRPGASLVVTMETVGQTNQPCMTTGSPPYLTSRSC